MGRTKSREHFLTLDFLRGVAALNVLLLHWFEGQGQAAFGLGYLAVDFFFLLSGFVIAYSYEERLLGGLSLFRFVAMRWVRLYPMILAGIVFGLLRAMAHARFAPEMAHPMGSYFLQVGANLFMLPLTLFSAAFPVETLAGALGEFPLDTVFWSLFFELAANVFYAAVVRHLSLPRLVALVLLGLAGVIALLAIGGPIGGGHGVASFWAGGTARVTFSFFLGVLLFRLRSRGALPKLAMKSGVLALVLFGLLALPYATVAFAPALAQLLMLGVIFPVMVIAGANDKPAGAMAALCRMGGELSYPIYVLQTPLMWILTGALKVGHLYSAGYAPYLALPVSLGICATAWVVLEYYDKPVRAWLGGKLRKSSV